MNRKPGVIHSLAAAFAIFAASAARAEILAGHDKFDKVDDERVDLFLRAVVDDTPYEPPPAFEPSIDPELKYIWAGNTVSSDTSLGGVNLTFSNPSSPQQTFKLQIQLGDEANLVRHDKTRRSRLAGGANMKVKGKAIRFYLEGLDDTSVAIVSANVDPTSTTRGLLICPRDVPTTIESGKKPELHLVPTDWRISEAKFTQPAARAQANILTGVDPGFAKASILTSPNLHRAVIVDDVAYQKDPVVSVRYSEFLEETLPPLDDPDDIVGGIRVKVIQHLNAGFKRVTRSWTNIWIKAVDFELPYKIMVPGSRFFGTPYGRALPGRVITEIKMYHELGRDHSKVLTEALIGRGRCYVILKETLPQSAEYSKEPIPANPS